MIEALWSVEFISNHQGLGAGVALLETGRILGGDGQYTYVGSYQIDPGGYAHARAKVSHYAGVPHSIFGPAKEFTLVLVGRPEHATFEMRGSVEGEPQLQISVRFTRRAELPRPTWPIVELEESA
jgi:hypothetical protein